MLIIRKRHYLLFVSILLIGILLYLLDDYHNSFYPNGPNINYEYGSSESFELDLIDEEFNVPDGLDSKFSLLG